MYTDPDFDDADDLLRAVQASLDQRGPPVYAVMPGAYAATVSDGKYLVRGPRDGPWCWWAYAVVQDGRIVGVGL